MRKVFGIFVMFLSITIGNLNGQQQSDSLGKWSFELSNGINNLNPTGYYNERDLVFGYKFGVTLNFKIYKNLFCSAGAGNLFLNEKNHSVFFPDTTIFYHFGHYQVIDFPFRLGWATGKGTKWKGYIALGPTLGILAKSKSVSTSPTIVHFKKNIWDSSIGGEGSLGVRYLFKNDFYLYSQLEVIKYSSFQFTYESSMGMPIDTILSIQVYDISFGLGMFFH